MKINKYDKILNRAYTCATYDHTDTVEARYKLKYYVSYILENIKKNNKIHNDIFHTNLTEANIHLYLLLYLYILKANNRAKELFENNWFHKSITPFYKLLFEKNITYSSLFSFLKLFPINTYLKRKLVREIYLVIRNKK